MPTRTYKCCECNHVYEQFRAVTEAHPDKCPKCGTKFGGLFTVMPDSAPDYKKPSFMMGADSPLDPRSHTRKMNLPELPEKMK